MNVVGKRLHVRKFVVGVEDAACVALAFPGVVDVDVDVAGVFHAGGDDLVGGVANVLVGDFAGEEVPAVPAHGRGQGNGIGRREGFGPCGCGGLGAGFGAGVVCAEAVSVAKARTAEASDAKTRMSLTS